MPCGCPQINSLRDWVGLLRPVMLMHLAPAVASTAVIVLAMHRGRHPLALPAVLTAIPALFHLVLLAGGWGLEDARAHGWLTRPTVSGVRVRWSGLRIHLPLLLCGIKSSLGRWCSGNFLCFVWDVFFCVV